MVNSATACTNGSESSRSGRQLRPAAAQGPHVRSERWKHAKRVQTGWRSRRWRRWTARRPGRACAWAAEASAENERGDASSRRISHTTGQDHEHDANDRSRSDLCGARDPGKDEIRTGITLKEALVPGAAGLLLAGACAVLLSRSSKRLTSATIVLVLPVPGGPGRTRPLSVRVRACRATTRACANSRRIQHSRNTTGL